MQDCLPAVTISVLMECTQLRTTRVEVFIDEGDQHFPCLPHLMEASCVAVCLYPGGAL